MAKLTLYHVSPAKNQESILESGVLPSKARGKWKASWWVTVEKLDWAIAHVSHNHNTPVSDLLIFSITLPLSYQPIAFIKTSWRDVFRCIVPVQISEVENTASYFAWNNPETQVKE